MFVKIGKIGNGMVVPKASKEVMLKIIAWPINMFAFLERECGRLRET